MTAPLPFSLGALALAALLAACSSVAEAPVATAPALPARFSQAPTPATPVPGWAALGDPDLAAWVQRSLAANLDLQQAAARVQRSRALAAHAGAALGPSGGLALGAHASQASETEAPGLDRDARRRDRVDAMLGFSWEADLFGRLRHGADAASARAGAASADAAALQLALGAEIAHAWFALAGAREQLAITRGVIENRRATLALVQRRAAAGYSAPLDEARARADLAAVEADVPALEAGARVAAHRLAVLAGELPTGFDVPDTPALDPARVALAVPAPAQWLATRPDLRAAEARLKAQSLDVASVRAEFLPRLSITGALGYVAGSAAALGTAGSAAWFVAPTLSLPLFDRARIEARLATARAGEREALLDYRQRVLVAVEEVENALVQVQQGQRRLAALHERAQQAERAERLARKRHVAGTSDLLELLDAQRVAQQAQLALAAALTAQRQQVVTLLRATAAPAAAA